MRIYGSSHPGTCDLAPGLFLVGGGGHGLCRARAYLHRVAPLLPLLGQGMLESSSAMGSVAGVPPASKAICGT